MHTRRFNFTQKALEALPPAAPGKRAYYRDTKVNGLVLAVTERGIKSFQAYRRVSSKPVRVTLGRFPTLPLDQARKRAQSTLARMVDGINPNAEKKAQQAQALTLQEVFTAYLRLHAHTLRPATVQGYQTLLRVAFAEWRDKPLVAISWKMVQQRHAQLGERSPARANMAMRLLRALFNFAAAQYDLMLDNPVKRLSAARAWFRLERRRTLIRPYQLAPWFAAVMALEAQRCTGKAAVVRDYLLFLLFTGLRRGEAARLQWHAVDFAGRTLTVIDTKNRQPHELPLSDFLLDLLERRRHEAGRSSFVFPGEGRTGHLVEPRRWVQQVIQESGVAFTLHDLRRSFITIAESLDIPAYVLKRLLNHKSGVDVTAGYLVIDTERLRDPMQKITDFILKAAGVKPSAVVIPFKTAPQ